MKLTHKIITGNGVKSVNVSSIESWSQFFGSDNTRYVSVYTLYQRVPWLNRAVNMRCEAIANLPYRIMRGETEVSNHRTDENKLPIEIDIPRFLNELEGDLILAGAAYWKYWRNAYGYTRQVVRWHPKNITPLFDEHTGLTGFQRTIGKGSDKKIYPPDEVGYIWIPNRQYEIGPGTPEAVAAMNSAGMLKNADEYGSNYFANGAIDPTIVSIPGYRNAPEEERKRFKSWVGSVFGRGNRRSHEPIPTDADVTISRLGTPIGDLAMPELTDKKREDIATALGVPQTLLFSNAANFATANKDDVNFYTKTVIPRAKFIQQQLNQQLLMPLGYRLEFDPEQMSMFQEDERRRAGALYNMTQAGVPLVLAAEELGFNFTERLGEMELERMAMEDRRRRLEAEANQPRNSGGMVSDNETSPEENAAAEELKTWERWYMKRFQSGKSPEREFETVDVPHVLKYSLNRALKSAQSENEIKLAFSDARDYVTYA